VPIQGATPRSFAVDPTGAFLLAAGQNSGTVTVFRIDEDAAAAADMLAWENSGFSVDASVRITLTDRDVPSYFQSLEHLLRYCARPPFALERLSVMRGEDGRIACVRYVLPRQSPFLRNK
jgi:hypothetical protein